MIERHLAGPREPAARRHERFEHHGQQVAPRREGPQRHERLRIIPSAMWRATAWIVEVGFTPAQVTIVLPSTM